MTDFENSTLVTEDMILEGSLEPVEAGNRVEATLLIDLEPLGTTIYFAMVL